VVTPRLRPTRNILPPRFSGLDEVLVLVAHPDDETLWCGGTLLANPQWKTTILSLCRGSDPDRGPKFTRACVTLGASLCASGDFDDGPEQRAMADGEVRDALCALLPARDFDMVLTHCPYGEYTRHRRHEETSRAVLGLWRDGELRARRMLLFAYEDAGRSKLPEARKEANLRLPLPDDLFRSKYSVVTEVYGFLPESWEAQATPRVEAFWTFDEPDEADRYFGALAFRPSDEEKQQ